MFNRTKVRLAGIVAAILSGLSLASTFNKNATGPTLRQAPLTTQSRRRSFRTGIKGIKGTNNTRYGAALQHHFASKA